MTEIKIPDKLTAALQAKAGSKALRSNSGFRKLADAETSATQDSRLIEFFRDAPLVGP